MAEGFAAMGHTIVGCSGDPLIFERLTALPGTSHDFAVVDVSSDEQVRNWLDRRRNSECPIC